MTCTVFFYMEAFVQKITSLNTITKIENFDFLIQLSELSQFTKFYLTIQQTYRHPKLTQKISKINCLSGRQLQKNETFDFFWTLDSRCITQPRSIILNDKYNLIAAPGTKIVAENDDVHSFVLRRSIGAENYIFEQNHQN